MRRSLIGMAFGFALLPGFALFLAGCGSAPADEINTTKAALTAAQSEEVRAYAPESLKAAEDELNKALAEVQAQDGRFFFARDYRRASEMLKVASDLAEKAKADAQVNRTRMKVDAEAALAALPALIIEARRTLARAPRGKDTRADLEAMQEDLRLADEALNEANQAMSQEKYLDALTKANSAKEKAEAIIEQVGRAMAKTRRRD